MKKIENKNLLGIAQAATFVLLACSLSLVAGCGDGSHTIARVSGIITLNGKPLANASVGFEPISTGNGAKAGPGTYGTTDEEGRYHLETLDGRKGGSIGKCRVSISTHRAKRGDDGSPVTTAEERVPAKYSSLTFEVPAEGTDSANFELTSK